ncbi:hypothetical protein TNCT_194311 [Trichonephila clavata]|uniref:Uncharacterized protein n=1 Tax=Trichonephila clavata TaxID=2740835 RepID=A0A8X6L7E0_TRICU|nr:hypothetical protein TNCT_194311 [Trichonephila clavata]
MDKPALAVSVKKASLSEIVEASFERYEGTAQNDDVKVFFVCLKNCENSLFCCVCEQPAFVSCSECYAQDKIEQKVCSLCLNKINIEIERQEAKDCLEIQAVKMKLLSGKSYSEASAGITFRIPVPEVDRGREDVRSVLAVVMENTEEGFF